MRVRACVSVSVCLCACACVFVCVCFASVVFCKPQGTNSKVFRLQYDNVKQGKWAFGSLELENRNGRLW